MSPRQATGQATTGRAAAGGGSTPSPGTDPVRAAVASALNVEYVDLTPDADLFALGLDSLTLIRLVSGWRRAGHSVTFEQLAETPTLADWATALTDGLAEATAGDAMTPDGVAPASGTTPPDETSVPSGETGGSPGVAAPFELATMQYAYWIGRQDSQPFGGVAAHFYVEFDGHGVDPQALGRALAALAARHGMLRARFDDTGRQWITTTGGPALTVHDLRTQPPQEVTRRLEGLRQRYTHQRMDVERGEVLAVALSLLPGGATRLHVDLDMLVADALSMRILLTDLHRLYRRPDEPLPQVTSSFPRYLAAHRRAAAADRDRARDWWHERLGELPGGPQLPLRPDAGRSGAVAHSERLHHWLDPRRKRTLLERAATHQVTPAAALATAFAEVLGTFSDDRRFLLNLPLFAREPLVPDVDLLVGDFSSSVLLGVYTSGVAPFVDRARRVQSALHAAVDHGAYAGVEVLRDLSRQAGQPMLAPVVYTSALGLGEIYDTALQDTFGTPSWIISQGPQVWLDAQVTELDGGLLLNWDVRHDVLADGVAGAAFTAYRELVEALVGTDDVWLRPVGSQLPAEQAAVREKVNATAVGRPARCLHDGFLRQAADRPQQPAVFHGERTVSYRELADTAARVHTLLAAHGVRPGDPVGVTLPKGIDQIAAVLGVLAAGACYLPVGIDQPAHRRARLHTLGEVQVVLTDPAHRELVSAAGARPLLVADAAALTPSTPAPADPQALAYVLFTSGSTGDPKGVEMTHAAAMNTVEALNARLGVGPHDRVLTLSGLEFDLSVYDIFGLLTAGGTLVVVGEDQRRDAASWWRLVTRHWVSVWNTVPALLDMLLIAATDRPVGADATTQQQSASALRAVLLGGDVIGPDLPGRLRAVAPACRFLALGGMTEAAIHSTVYEVPPAGPQETSMPWGVPLDNVVCRVADGDGRDRPDWVTGELWVGGASLARGYRGDPQRTAGKFVTYGGRRWYRSGDLARYRPDGTLEFLGRADHQVKVRGHRIELGEVEAALVAHPAIEQAVAMVTGEGPARRLAAAVTMPSASAEAGPPDDLDGWLAERLPEHMRCDSVTVWPQLPLTGNGKVDRAAVRAALTADVELRRTGDRPEQPPHGPLETLVAAVWSDLLGVARVNRDDSFFALGGDSLLATGLLVRLRGSGVQGARLAALFTNPRLADFAAGLTLDAAPGPATPADSQVVVPDPTHRFEPFPPTDVQRAYLVGRDPRLPLGGVGTWQYIEFDGVDVDLDRLHSAWLRLVDRHEMLRAVFDADGNQRILAAVLPVRIDLVDVGDSDPAAALADLRAARSHLLTELSRWPLFDLAAVRYREAGQVRTRVAVGLDYIVFDALSIMTLYTELDLLYHEPDADLPPIEVSFRDYLLQVVPDPESVDQDQRYWTRRLAGLPPAPQLPTTRHPTEVTRPRFTRRQRWLAPPQWAAIKNGARQHGLTPSTVLLAAYAETLGAWSGRRDLTVTLTLFNRRDAHPHIYRVLGDFTTLSLADYRPTAGGTFLADVTALHRRMGEDLDHREVSPAWLLRELARVTGSMEAMPVVFTSAIGVGDGVSMDRSDGFPQPVWGISQSPQVCLDNQVLESRAGLLVTWDSVDDLFLPGVLDAMFDAYLRLLDRLAETAWDAPLPALLPAGQRTVRDRVNAAQAPIPRQSLHAGVFAAARRTPEHTALIWHDSGGDPATMTYAELAEHALRTAGALGAAGVRRGDPVAITLPKGAQQVVAALGVLAAGAVYVPVGVEQPALRRERIYRDAGVVAAIVDTGAQDGGLPALSPEAALAAVPLAAPVPVDPDDSAYVIFTSGSTGTPKGVEISHDAAANTCTDINTRFGVGPDDRVLALSALDFDLSVYDIFGVLGAGGTLVLPAEDERRDAPRWLTLVAEHGVTLWNTVPTLLDMLLVAAEPDQLPASLRLALVSGDWVGLDLPGRLAAATAGRADGGCRLVALGGATEASIWSNAFEVAEVPDHWRSVPYGFPLANQAYRVVDDAGRDRPDWVAGELWIGGRGVARGYRGDPTRSAEKFVSNRSGRWYRTGDLGRYWPDGTLEFLGRVDHQVKVGGHRLELGEIEAAMEAHPHTGRAVVVVTGGRNARRLHGFVEAGGGSSDVPRSLRRFLGERLPGYAIPARISVLDALPLTSNGKVDRAALGDRAATDGESPGRPPVGETETAIAQIWQELLGVPVSDREANFFTLGGDSVSALRMLTSLRQRYGVDVAVRRFLAAATVAELAAAVASDTLDTNENEYDFGLL
ncbi:amino acid adenylation domain-containing protein [Micromonospora sp. Llam0]|uniref:non-ribosomal peptide synthetase n=1 Tax=Micromonospora sp. Llam0 TaxID=2485143 RepID=UPI000F47DF8B|nr:non-ribosomal peptide synthetase [Micromonospora sp. Llam0]ROO59760.1 amino acid adenylation domain-containing protein [Micromonospora sp. Llam0]